MTARADQDVVAAPPHIPGGKKQRALLPVTLLTLCVLTIGLCSSQPLASPNSAGGFEASVVQSMRLASARSAQDSPKLPQGTLDNQAFVDPAALAPARPLRFKGSAVDRERAIECLALAAWYEAGDDPEGQRSVIQVVLNRMNHPSFPKSICGVVFQGSHLDIGCQFTFTCDGSLDRRRPGSRAADRARALATKAIGGAVYPDVMHATHYHADYVTPWWSGKLQRLATVRRHIFYRWPGGRGSLLSSARYSGEQDPSEFGFTDGSAIIDPAQLEGRENLSANLVPAGGQSSNPSGKIPGSGQLVALDLGKPSGRWAVQALGRCKGQDACQVVGYANADDVERNRFRHGSARERPLFLFVRDPVSGMDLALWDCAQTERPNKSQCLPDDETALRQLMRERGS